MTNDYDYTNTDTELRNCLININNNYNNYSLRVLIRKIDVNYYKILEMINNDIMLSEDFKYRYDVIDNIVSDNSYNDNNIYDITIVFNMMNVIEKIINNY